VLSVAEVNKASFVRSRYHLTQKSDEREEDLEETFPLPAPQPGGTTAADEVDRERDRRLELCSGLRARREVPPEHLDGPPDGEPDEKRSGQSVTTKCPHLHLSDVAHSRLAKSVS